MIQEDMFISQYPTLGRGDNEDVWAVRGCKSLARRNPAIEEIHGSESEISICNKSSILG